MLDLARRSAARVAGIEFVEGNAVDSSCYADRSFDLVLNMDGAISFCGALAGQAIAESCRVTAETVILTVSPQAQMVPVWVTGSLVDLGRLVPAVYDMAERGERHQDEHLENPALTRDMT